LERNFCLPSGVLRAKRRLEFASIGDGAGDVAALFVELQPVWQAFCGKAHRSIAGRGNRVEKRPAGTLAIDARAVDTRRRPGGRGENLARRFTRRTLRVGPPNGYLHAA